MLIGEGFVGSGKKGLVLHCANGCFKKDQGRRFYLYKYTIIV